MSIADNLKQVLAELPQGVRLVLSQNSIPMKR